MGLPVTWNSQQYSANLTILTQQMGSKLRNTVSISPDGFVGEYKFVDQLDAGEMVEVTSRWGDTEWEDPDAKRRRIAKQYYEYAKLFDNFEKLNRLNDPTSKEMVNAAYAVGRQWDDMIIAGMTATAYTGQTGSASTTLASYDSGSHVIANGGTGLTLDKLQDVRRLFNAAEVDQEAITFVVAAIQLDNLLDITEIKNADYNSVKALVNGQPGTFLGFKFIMCNRLAVATSIRKCLAYAQSGFELAISKDMTTTVDRLPMKRNALGLQTQMAGGGVRLEEKKVISVDCSEA